ncbi:alpha/beta hydrolase [Sphingomonas sp. SUN019]|uniref:alpha/beta fold hydrolase n=1 Tax=Sphingomonas sp. SUN019 TaxID=2937788 RepID=UPI002164D1D5|nr:alpha/beta hydrolase [Sphingomonas sp. SUN019]UVO50712.1 alpha/beta hydrolase [Sphingomonas sp. SUN019]
MGERIRRRYVDGRYGQVHLRENTPVAGVPLICLHATAYASRSFGALLAALDGTRHVIAIDTPGYGESDAPPMPIGIAAYAAAIAEVLPERFDLFGYHTGVSIAAEIAIAEPERVGRLTMMGVPYFQAIDFAGWRARLAARHELRETLAQFEERWDFLVMGRPEGLPLHRGFENFVDELKAWPNGWWAHAALFDHDLTARLPLIPVPVTVLNPPGHLADPSRVAAALIPDATVVELPELSGAVLDRHADVLARLVVATEEVVA